MDSEFDVELVDSKEDDENVMKTKVKAKKPAKEDDYETVNEKIKHTARYVSISLLYNISTYPASSVLRQIYLTQHIREKGPVKKAAFKAIWDAVDKATKKVLTSFPFAILKILRSYLLLGVCQAFSGGCEERCRQLYVNLRIIHQQIALVCLFSTVISYVFSFPRIPERNTRLLGLFCFKVFHVIP